MATLPTKVIPHAGLILASSDYVAAAVSGGDKAVTGSGLLLLVKNGDSVSRTVTLAVPETVDSLAVTSRAVPIPAGDEAFIPLLDLYKDPATGLASFTYDVATSLTVAVVRTA
jgi:hypothetical protein